MGLLEKQSKPSHSSVAQDNGKSITQSKPRENLEITATFNNQEKKIILFTKQSKIPEIENTHHQHNCLICDVKDAE